MHETHHRLPAAMVDPGERKATVTRAVDYLRASGYRFTCPADLIDHRLPPTLPPSRSLAQVGEAIAGAGHTRRVADALSELTAPGDGVLDQAVAVLHESAAWWEGLGGASDPHYAARLRYIADMADGYVREIRAMRGDLADRHTAHAGRARPAAQATAGPDARVLAALATSPTDHRAHSHRPPGRGRPRHTGRRARFRAAPLTPVVQEGGPLCPAATDLAPPTGPPSEPAKRNPTVPAAEPSQLPDVAVGQHPNHGIVASLPTHNPAAQWMLERLDFQRLSGNPRLYTLTEQHREAPERAVWAAKLLTGAGYRVDTDISLTPENANGKHRANAPQANATPEAPRPQRAPAQDAGPDVAIAEHPSLGVVAAVNDDLPFNPGIFLDTDGWRYRRDLDVYLPPAGTREESLDVVAHTVAGLRRGNFQVAMQPQLAEDVAAHRGAVRQAFTTHKFRVDDAALKGPARPAVPTVTTAVPGDSRPPTAVDPRIAFARTR
ncbi:hypothetical protein ACGF07_07955 [Kitasatospora sp. NPDC048194]|uniref:hypothetical protein n=1 Tax=Kitasatospora sp. NPDC048194 TaxID=3364045 RepID=UPI0037183407